MLEKEWGIDGFLDELRRGKFAMDKSDTFLTLLRNIKLGNDHEQIPKRLVSLLWYLPCFLEWQKERIKEKGGDEVAYRNFVTQVINALEQALGIP